MKQIINVVFFGAMVFLTAAILIVLAPGEKERSILGYRYYHILTGSMDSVYPQGSVVLVKETAEGEVKTGDDITFFVDQDMTVTHRVIDVIEGYDEETGAAGYETQGTENLNPDPDITHEYNVIGRVVFCIPYMGSGLMFLKTHWKFVGLMLAAVFMSITLARTIIRRSRNK